MSLLALPLMLAVAAQPAPGPARQLVTASVEIIAAEEIRFSDFKAVREQRPKAKIVQRRTRDAMPMIEFY
jgi:hypothetical protein